MILFLCLIFDLSLLYSNLVKCYPQVISHGRTKENYTYLQTACSHRHFTNVDRTLINPCDSRWRSPQLIFDAIRRRPLCWFNSAIRMFLRAKVKGYFKFGRFAAMLQFLQKDLVWKCSTARQHTVSNSLWIRIFRTSSWYCTTNSHSS